MAGRQSVPGKATYFAAGAAILLLAAWYAAPAAASSNTPVAGDEETKSYNDEGVLSPSHYLAPRVESALQKIFSDRRPTMTTRVPGVSDDELARYKRQMYRKDI